MSIFQKWYWRVVTALVAGILCGAPVIVLLQWIQSLTMAYLSGRWDDLAFLGMIGGGFSLVGVVVYGALTRWLRVAQDNETRCRKCGYILRGITEPRCSECGERI